METRAFRKHALCPKPSGVRRTTLPTMPYDLDLERFLGALAPDERKALAAIVEEADLIQAGGASFLLARVTPEILDTLAAFGADEPENDLEDEPDEDAEDHQDLEPSLAGSYGGDRCAVDGEQDEAGPSPFRARGLPEDHRHRGDAEVQKLNAFLRARGKHPVSTLSVAGGARPGRSGRWVHTRDLLTRT